MNKPLANKINYLVKKDQNMRRPGNWDTKIDKDNTKELKKIIKKYGWPDLILVGKKASQGAWLLAQHADHDVKFQQRCLKLMFDKYKTDKIEPQYIPYLTDRVLVNQGKPQLYGTQFYLNKFKQFVPRPIKSENNLEKLRKKFGLEPFTKYQKRLQARQREIIKSGGNSSRRG